MSIPSLTWVRTGLAALLRVTPFDTSTAEGRAMERHRRVALTAAASVGAKSIGIATMLVSVPLTLGYLGAERYGVWMTLSSLVVLLGFADLGVGNGLLNAVAKAHGMGDQEAALRVVSSGFYVLLALAAALGTLFVSAYRWIPWQRVFNVSPELLPEAGPAAAVLIGVFLVGMPLGVTSRVRNGCQEGFTNSLWSAAGSLLGLGGVLAAISLRAGLPWLVLAMSGGPLVATALNGFVLFGFRRPWLRPQWRHAGLLEARQLAQLGLLFLILQTAWVLIQASDNLILAQVYGPRAVAEYSVVARLFSVIPLALGMVLFPLWPAYGEAIAMRDVEWAQQTLVRSLAMVVLVSVPASAILGLLGKPIVHLWASRDITPTTALLLGLALWTVLSVAGSAVAMFLNGTGAIAFQAASASALVLVGVPLKVVLTMLVGISGVVWGSIAAYTVCSAIPMLVLVPRLLTRLKSSR